MPICRTKPHIFAFARWYRTINSILRLLNDTPEKRRSKGPSEARRVKGEKRERGEKEVKEEEETGRGKSRR